MLPESVPVGGAARLLRSLLKLILVVLAGGFAASALVRYSPGFDIDDNAWNPKVSAETLAAMHARREHDNSLPRFYLRYVSAAVHGNLGNSDLLNAPVSELLAQRLPVTAKLVGYGTGGGLLLGAAFAWLAVWPRRAAFGLLAGSVSGLLLAIPPAVLALAFFFAEAPLALAVALTVMPRVFGTMRALFAELLLSPALLAARARGVPPIVLGVRYVLRAAAPQLFALCGVALVLAFGSIIPIEALCDVPGIGQLALLAAKGRDLPLLSGLALLITFVVASVETVGDLAGGVRG